ncbi:TRAP transporter permease [Maledivibacter halophilus]|uniref:TRAP transporter, 4TM/12TM fusion protein n=1 Tax=Maledivibacter halophilus TaxID=36842 RepID=A0A1T5IBQ4_9FIRM|nr:TRAP transporter permease [Maledivibacter halophilus]SKC36606.1 TRAP transporter, 4TM/12TM fusion protein [Maledivibacter halophilus]
MTNIIENNNSERNKTKYIIALSIILSAFHLYTASFGILPSYAQASIHWAIIATFIVFTRPSGFSFGGKLYDFTLVLITWYASYYLIHVQEELVTRVGLYTNFEIVLAIAAVIAALLIATRVVGKILPVICIIFILYSMFGSKISGMFNTQSFSISRIATYLYTSGDGLYGQTLNISARFIFLFVLFGAILDLTGAGNFYVDLAYSLTGRVSGGPAQAAITSSVLLGMINGSGAANVVTTGTFTIPLMKKVGYKPSIAGAVEAVASCGGQIMPPVMGAAAFLMSEITGIPYSKIILSALIPALLYYFTLAITVYIYAKEKGLKGMKSSELPKVGKVFKEGWMYLLPIVCLITILMRGYSPQKAAYFSIIIALLVGFVKKRDDMNVKNILGALMNAIKNIAPIASACILAGIIMSIINLTGLGIKISSILEFIAQGNLIIALILAMLTSLLLGMGLPTSASYLILAVLVGPALVNMGVSLMGAHLFILYFGALSTITPPVALSTFAAAGIAGSDIWETGIEALKLAVIGFIVPFIFAFSDLLLLEGNILDIIVAIITGFMGCTFIAVAIRGWFIKKLNVFTRFIVAGLSIFLIVPISIYVSLIVTLIICMVLAIGVKMKRA